MVKILICLVCLGILVNTINLWALEKQESHLEVNQETAQVKHIESEYQRKVKESRCKRCSLFTGALASLLTGIGSIIYSAKKCS